VAEPVPVEMTALMSAAMAIPFWELRTRRRMTLRVVTSPGCPLPYRQKPEYSVCLTCLRGQARLVPSLLAVTASRSVAGEAVWDVAVIGTGPAGAVAAREAALAGAGVVLVEKAELPRYKCCGGGLIGPSLANLPVDVAPFTRDEVSRITFTKDGRQRFTRTAAVPPVFRLVMRAALDDALTRAAVAAGVTLRTGTTLRGIEQERELVRLATTSGEIVARVVVGADGSAGRAGGHVGVRSDQVDLGLEGEFAAPASTRRHWAGRAHIDWGLSRGATDGCSPRATCSLSA
jgi:hypothetical protein